MSEMLRGYAVVSLCGLAVFPLVHHALRALPDRGYSVCRCFGWVAASWEQSDKGKRARFYRLTPPGRKQLAAERAQWEKLSRRVNLILSGANT